MSDENKDVQEQPRFVDPNSGAAPQPGGFAAAAPVNQEEVAAKEVVEPETQPEEPEAGPKGEPPAESGTPEGESNPEGGTTESGQSQVGDGSEQPPAGEEQPQSGEQPAGEQPKDYSRLLDKNADEVKSYMDEHPEEKAAVQAAEQEREKPRKGILEY